MKIKPRITTALTAVFLCLPVFTLPVYIQGTEPKGKLPTQEETTTTKPFIPEGTGTMVNSAIDEDGKEFYTIQTPDECVFFLAIGKQYTSEDVYFLDAVAEKNLLPLIQVERGSETVEPEPEPTPAPKEPTDEPEPEPAPEPTEENSPMGAILLVMTVAVISDGTDWYLKIYRPEHRAPDLDEEETDFEAKDDEPVKDDDLSPWDRGELEKEDEE